MAWLGISTRNETPRIDRGGWLDGLRFIVALLIIIHHYQLAAPIPLQEFHPLFERSGYLLTNFFIIDSGYVLMRVYGARVVAGGMSAPAFWRKRFLRVVPAHLVVSLILIGFVLLSALMGFAPRHPEWFAWDQLPAQVFLVQAYGVHGGLGWNAPTWSVSGLLGCYLLFPLLARPMSRHGPRMALGLALGVYAMANLLTWAILDLPAYQMPMKYGIWRVLPLFFLGMALARFSETVFVPARVAAAVGIAAAMALFAVQLFGRFGLPTLALTCVIVLAAGALPVLKKSRAVETLAMMSFSMFITNEVTRIIYFGVVNQMEARLDLPAALHWGLWAGGVAAALAAAAAFHYAIDMPMQRTLNGKRLSPRATVAAPRPAFAAE